MHNMIIKAHDDHNYLKSFVRSLLINLCWESCKPGLNTGWHHGVVGKSSTKGIFWNYNFILSKSGMHKFVHETRG